MRLPSNKTATPQLDWDPATNTISFALPEVSFPIAIAFGVSVKLPDPKLGSFSLSFPSLKFGAKGEVESSDSSDDEQKRLREGMQRRISNADTTAPKVFHQFLAPFNWL